MILREIYKKKIIAKNIFVFCLLSLTLFFGCAKKVPLTESDEYSYYYPTWTTSGKIIALRVKETYQTRNQITLVNDAEADIVTMDNDGSNETTIVSDVFAYLLQASPQNDYLAGEVIIPENISPTNDERIRSKVIVWNINSGAEVASFNTTTRAYWLDWGPNGQKVAVMQATENITTPYQLHVYQPITQGAATTLNLTTDVRVISWKYNSKIAYIKDNTSDKIAFINDDGTGKEETDLVVGFPFAYIKSTNFLDTAKDGVKRIDLSQNPKTEQQLHSYSLENYQTVAISPDGAKMALTKYNDQWGLYVLDVAANTVEKLK